MQRLFLDSGRHPAQYRGPARMGRDGVAWRGEDGHRSGSGGAHLSYSDDTDLRHDLCHGRGGSHIAAKAGLEARLKSASPDAKHPTLSLARWHWLGTEVPVG